MQNIQSWWHQDYDTAEETNDEDLPDLDTFETDWDEVESASGPMRGQYPDHVITLDQSEAGVRRQWSQPGPGIIYPKSNTFPR